MAARILSQFKRRITAFELEPSSGGCFEFSVNDEIVFSKLEIGRFPNEEDMVEEVAKRMSKAKV